MGHVNPASTPRILQFIGITLLLVAVDQITKLWALHLVSVRHAMGESKVLGLGLLIHLPERSELYYALSALFVIAVTIASPVSRMVKAFWVAAGISNHGEMILRHGSVDFLAFRVGSQILVANVADLYLAIGFIVLAVKVARLIRRTQSWTQPLALAEI